MKVVVLNNLSDKEFREVIGGHEIVTLSKNYLKKYYNADLFTDCKRVTTALRRFFKALEKDYISFNNYKKEIEESVRQGIYTKSLFEKFDFGFTIGMTHEGYYISVTVPMEQEEPEEPEEQEEQEKENTSMEDIKIKTSWSKILKDENEWSDTDKEYIVLDVDMKGVTWDLGCDIMDALEDKINEEGFYSCSREGCPDFDEERDTFSDCLFFERDYGSIKEQRKAIIKYVNSIKKEVIKEVLKEEQEEQEVTEPEQEEQEVTEPEQEEQEQEEENTNMKNIKIKKTDRGYYTVIADTQKFGTNEILFEGRNIEECKNYIKRTLIFILKAQLQTNRTQEAENTIKTLISYLNDKKQKTINNNIAKSWELFSTGAINMEISETEKGYYFVGEQAPVKFTFFIDKEGKDTRKEKNDKVVNTLTENFVVEF